MKYLWIAMTICFCVAQANAQSILRGNDGKTLFDWCISDQRTPAYLQCILLVKGFIDGYRAAKSDAIEKYKSKKLCLPERSLGPDEVAAAFVRTWRNLEREQKANATLGQKWKAINEEDAGIVLAVLLMRAYPCQNNP